MTKRRYFYEKNRYWAFVLYLESAPSDWKEILQQTGLPFCISPYHDKDINADGTIKKPHYHIILCFNGPTTYNNVKSITDSLNQPIPIALQQVKGYYRYLTHKDNPEKYQYDEKDITCYNGFYPDDYVDLTNSQVKEIIKVIFNIITTFNILEYSELIDYLLKNDLNIELDIASNHTILFNTYITSRRNKLKEILTRDKV